MTLPRGFKANAEREAERLRHELDLRPTDAVDPRRIAAHLNVTVVDGAELIGREPFEQLEAVQKFAFSAATFDIRDRKIIVTNPVRTSARINSDIAHELAHVLLNHDLAEVQEINGVPFRTCQPDEEEQATAFGGTLLLPRPLLLAAGRRGMRSPEQLASEYAVTSEMARYRYNSTGVGRQLSGSR